MSVSEHSRLRERDIANATGPAVQPNPDHRFLYRRDVNMPRWDICYEDGWSRIDYRDLSQLNSMHVNEVDCST
jgi:hypothetical protein